MEFLKTKSSKAPQSHFFLSRAALKFLWRVCFYYKLILINENEYTRSTWHLIPVHAENTKSAEKQKANFPKESVENANLHKPVLNKTINNVWNIISNTVKMQVVWLTEKLLINIFYLIFWINLSRRFWSWWHLFCCIMVDSYSKNLEFMFVITYYVCLTSNLQF